MPAPATAPEVDLTLDEAPHSRLAAHLVERHYGELGCNGWDTRRVQRLMAKLGDTPAVLAARMRIRKCDLDRRMQDNVWSKQDGLILTMLEREVDFIKGGVPPKPLVPGGTS